MTATNIVIVAIVLALLSIVSIILLKVSSKEYPQTEEKTSEMEVGKITYSHCTAETEKPKRKKKRYYNKKKPAVANNAQAKKRPVGRPKKSN